MAGTLRPDGGGIIAGNGIQQNIMFRHNIAKIANGHKVQHAEPRIAVLRSLDQLPQLVFAGGKKPAFVQAAVQLIKHPWVRVGLGRQAAQSIVAGFQLGQLFGGAGSGKVCHHGGFHRVA